MAHRFVVSQDSPVLYITIVTKDRLAVFRSDEMKEVLCRAIDEARKSAATFSAPKARNVIAWAIGPGKTTWKTISAESAK